MELRDLAKLEDLYRMHAYRDALNINFAIVLYPGEQSIFFDKNKIKNWILKKLIIKENGGKLTL